MYSFYFKSSFFLYNDQVEVMLLRLFSLTCDDFSDHRVKSEMSDLLKVRWIESE